MKQINKVAVLGAGVMGATIAAHLANAGIEVLLLDIVPDEPNDAEREQVWARATARYATESPRRPSQGWPS